MPMNITSKSRYALKIMMDLANQKGAITHRAEIAQRQGIPLDYMDQILGRLREGRLIDSIRGRSGGYRLAREARSISVHDIFTMVEDAFEPVRCLEGGVSCTMEHACSSKDAWTTISTAIRQALSGILLADLADHAWPASLAAVDLGIQECRAPRRRSGAEELNS
ncbi:hypothetical protein E3A20_27130 [Planctomyces bekefii]|uniref:Rrf2 family transcriptional regulator n=1 Tax=Planctomyces bekefii TaxID=1653850 RepID=A0A5C6M0N4_9PLAN|nr:hypothetical protein E3A20_27130 [Planctomyces bekefii]